MENDKIIQTTLKLRPKKGFTHIIGAKLLSEKLLTIPMFDEIDLIFDGKMGSRISSNIPGWYRQSLKGDSTDLLDYREVISSTYHNKWTIRIRAIQYEKKNAIKQALLKYGLKKVEHWLKIKRPKTWFEGQHVLQVGIDEDIKSICFRETHNDKILSKEKVKIEIDE